MSHEPINERRLELRTGEWVTYATHRQDRTFLPAADACPLCPTSDAAHPTELPHGSFDVAVFENRFPSMRADPPLPGEGPIPGITAAAEGAAEVIVYSPDHERSLAQLEVDQIQRIVDVWADRYAELGARDDVAYVFIFENRGVEVGVTLHHPHGQIYAFPEIPPRIRAELEAAAAHRARTERCVSCDTVSIEHGSLERVVHVDEHVLAFVPFAARYPYEVHVATRRHATSLLDLRDPERRSLAAAIRTVVRAYDALFGFPMPYVLAVHQAPTDAGRSLAISHLHLEFTPPYRTAQKLKYLAGSELGAGAFMNDTRPETTADELRAAIDRSR